MQVKTMEPWLLNPVRIAASSFSSLRLLVFLLIAPGCALYSVPYRDSETISQAYDYDKNTTFRAVRSHLNINGFVILRENPSLGHIQARYSFPGTATWGSAAARMTKYVESPFPLVINPYGKNSFVTISVQVEEPASNKSQVSVRAHFQTWGEPQGVGGVGPFSMTSKHIWEREFLNDLVPMFAMISKQTTPASATGTGFLLDEGYLLTAQHIIAGRSKITAHLEGRRFAASVVLEDAVNDLALLKLDGDLSAINQTGLPLGDSSTGKQGEKVWTLGYPLSELLGEKSVLNEGSISSVYGLRGDPRLFQISVPIQPGSSGGPLLNGQGEVIGVAVSSLDDIAILRATGAIPQNVNFAIKINYAFPLLSSIPKLKTASSREKNPITSNFSEMVEQVRPKVVLIQAAR